MRNEALPTVEQEQAYREMLRDFVNEVNEVETDAVKRDAVHDMAKEYGFSEAEVMESLNEFPLV